MASPSIYFLSETYISSDSEVTNDSYDLNAQSIIVKIT